MEPVYQAALIGCGDYLRWEIDTLNASKHLNVKYTYDTDSAKSEKRAKQLSAKQVQSVDDIFSDETIKVVLVFTPPFAREEYIRKAVESGKHIITTKPLAPNLAAAENLYKMVQNKVNCSVFYGRTGDASADTLKRILDSGEIGQLAIYKEDWFHHYPTWNKWATMKDKNGGPFMDAMVHNLNKSRYLIGSKVKNVVFSSENYAQKLDCNDTEFMQVYFENGSVAYLFITWAADLPVYDPTGNDREHIGIQHLITNQGWYISFTEINGVSSIKAVKEDKVKSWPVVKNALTPYDDYVMNIEKGIAQPFDIKDAIIDIEILNKAYKLG